MSSDDTPTPLPQELTDALARLDELVLIFDQHPDPLVKERATAMLQCVDRIHRGGLRQVAELLKASGLQRPALEDPEVRLLFDLYELSEGGDRARADAVLDAVRPYIESHGGRLDVLGAEAGVVTVRLSGACHGCQGSAATLRQVVEQALRDGLTDFVRMDVAEPPPKPRKTPANFVPLETLLRPAPSRLRWVDVLRPEEIPPGEARAIEVEGEPVLIVNLSGEFYAYRNACPGSTLALDPGAIEGTSIRCPWHGCRFDLRGGKRLDAQGPGLGVIPIASSGGQVRIGLLNDAA